MLSKEKFILRSNEIHNNKYDYSLLEYKNSTTKVKIICPNHGEFEQDPFNHMNGHGCKKCSHYILSINQRKYNEFLKESNDKFKNKYDYSLVEYKNRKTKVKIICPNHGEFLSTPINHLNRGCPKCSKIDVMQKNKNKFINKSKELHSNKYDYSLVDYKSDKIKVRIICEKHGVFFQQPNTHVNGAGCPSCSCSKGEIKISEYLKSNYIKFETQKKFEKCSFVNNLHFDFYLPEYNICIEFDGRQHFKSIAFFGGIDGYNKTKIRDNIKNKYCIDNKIKIIRIPYYNFNKIDKILNENIWEH